MVVTQNLVGTKLGNYRLERLLGRGRMGVVYLARDEALLRPTAVKLLSWTLPDHFGQNPEAWFLAEARNVARVNHPHVVQIYGVAKHGANCYIAMEYVDGGPADAWVTDDGPFSVERATEILIQAAGALQAAHSAGVVHRDVKPGNLLVSGDGTAKLGDFGMALYLPGDRSPDPIRAGTPLYTAPEIWRGQAASPATDLYALGATYFYLLTGHPPFETHDLQTLISAHLDSPPPSTRQYLAGLPAGCDEIIQQCLAKSSRDRPASAQQVAWEARGLLRRLHSAPPPSGLDLEALIPAERHRSLAPQPPPKWLDFFGFASQPFAAIDPARPPATGEPFCATRQQLKQLLERAGGSTVLLEGPPGSGRTTLANQMLLERAPHGQVAYLGQEDVVRARSLQYLAARAFGVVAPPSGAHGDIDRLLDHLERAYPGKGLPALLVLDNASPSPGWLKELSGLVRAASATGSFHLLLLATPELRQRMAESGLFAEKLEFPALQVRPLSGPETRQYIMDWFRAALSPTSPEIVLTPDAGLLVAHRSDGNLGRINRIMSNMLAIAASERRRMLSSWDAWSASEEQIIGSATPLPSRPEAWPTAEVLQILNARRRESGIAPRGCLSSPDGQRPAD